MSSGPGLNRPLRVKATVKTQISAFFGLTVAGGEIGKRKSSLLDNKNYDVFFLIIHDYNLKYIK
jgi:hypothetical protein